MLELELVHKERGRHFDPALVDLFFPIESKILDLKERYREGKKFVCALHRTM